MGLLLIFLVVLLAPTESADGTANVRPRCEGQCGGVTVPYPFGIGDTCSLNGNFNITCVRPSTGPPRAYIGNMSVTDISLSSGQFRVWHAAGVGCYDRLGNLTNDNDGGLDLAKWRPDLAKHLRFSDTHNKFTVLGCDTVALVVDQPDRRAPGWDEDEDVLYNGGCISYCSSVESMTNGTCSGIGCCQTSIPKGLWYYETNIVSFGGYKNCWEFNRCGYAFIADEEWYKFQIADLNNESFGSRLIPVVLDWSIGNQTCKQMQQAPNADYACRSIHSYCVDSPHHNGYLCNCTEGYEGNPYLDDGCQDIDECNHSRSDYPCNGICTNTPGGYKCTCRGGTTAAGDPKKVTCMPDRNALSLPLILGLGLGFGLLFLLFCNFCAVWEFQRRKLKKMKRILFERHGGDFLKQQLSSFRGSNFRIYSEEQLKRATNKFHHDHIVGEGSQGTVYKGTLEPNGEVAIKRFKGIDEKRSKEFAQEIIILSQLFHKNVVKLLGCCLEVEAPMLVYEFTPGGNLFDLIHSRERRGQFSLDARIRIAAETAEALAYLHSYAATPIIHGDIKSSNILLDETHIPKVSDFRASRLAPKNKVQLATVVQGTCGYLDPEYLQTCQLTEKSDVYSFGVVLVELLTRKKPLDFEGPEEERSLALHFVSSMKEDRLIQILDDELVQEGEMKRLLEVAQLACQCLILKGADRPTMKEVVISLNAIGKFPKAPMVP